MSFLKAHARPRSSRNCNSSQENFHSIDDQSDCKRNEKDEIKIDTECWIRSYCRSQDSLYASNGKYRLSRLLNIGRNYLNKVNLKKRLAGVTCLHYKRQNRLEKPLARPVLRSPLNDESPGKICVNEVVREIQEPKYEIRIKVKPTSCDTLNELSPTSSYSEGDELRLARSLKKKTKHRKVTTYYSSKAVNARNPSAKVYYSTRRPIRNCVHERNLRGFSKDKKAVGRHLEWLKFLA